MLMTMTVICIDIDGLFELDALFGMALGVDLFQISVIFLALIRNAIGGDKDVGDDDNGHHDSDGPVELDVLF